MENNLKVLIKKYLLGETTPDIIETLDKEFGISKEDIILEHINDSLTIILKPKKVISNIMVQINIEGDNEDF